MHRELKLEPCPKLRVSGLEAGGVSEAGAMPDSPSVRPTRFVVYFLRMGMRLLRLLL